MFEVGGPVARIVVEGLREMTLAARHLLVLPVREARLYPFWNGRGTRYDSGSVHQYIYGTVDGRVVWEAVAEQCAWR